MKIVLAMDFECVYIVCMTAKQQATLMEKVHAFRLDRNLTWNELGLLCGLAGTTLRASVKRRAISERLAAQVIKHLGSQLNGAKG